MLVGAEVQLGNVAEWVATLVALVVAVAAALSARRSKADAEDARAEADEARDVARQHAEAAKSQADAAERQAEEVAGVRAALEALAGKDEGPVWQIRLRSSSPIRRSYRLKNVGTAEAIDPRVTGCAFESPPPKARIDVGLAAAFSVKIEPDGDFPVAAEVTSIGFEPVIIELPTVVGGSSVEVAPTPR